VTVHAIQAKRLMEGYGIPLMPLLTTATRSVFQPVPFDL
jgi:hypothetical protein